MVGSITIPANSYFCITARGTYNNNICTGVAIATTDTTYKNACALKTRDTDEYHVSCTYCKYTDSELTLYLWGKWEKASSNFIDVTGFYIPAL